jgi:hypothetical protein
VTIKNERKERFSESTYNIHKTGLSFTQKELDYFSCDCEATQYFILKTEKMSFYLANLNTGTDAIH